MSELDDKTKEIIDEARNNLDLIERLKGRNMRTSSVKVYTDEVTAEELIAARGEAGDEPSTKQKKDILALEKALEDSAFIIHLQALPEVANKVAARKARKKFVNKETGTLPPESTRDFETFFKHTILSQAITKVEDVRGEKVPFLATVESVEELEGYLPPSEWEKLEKKLDDVVYRQVISDAVTLESPDF